MADVLGMSGSDIRIIQPTIGGAFGSKLDLYPYEIICAHLARIAGRPVRISFTRMEEFCCTPTRQPAIIESEAGVDADGKLTFREAHIILDAGAYVSWGPTIPYVMMNSFSSLYRVPNVSFDTTIAYTNNIYAGAFRGYGNPQGTFVVETQMDELAELVNMDPLVFRILNSNRPGETTPQGMKVTTCGLEECLKRAAKGINWHEDRRGVTGKIRRGVGLASFFHVGGGARVYRSDGCGAIVKIDDFGQVTLITGSSEIGQGSETVLAQITAEELGVRVEDVKVINSDTDIKPWDVGVHASRTTFIAGNAARIAAAKAKRKILEMAAPEMGLQCDELDINNRFIYYKANPEKRVRFDKILRKKHFDYNGNIIVTEHFYDPPTQRQDRNFKGTQAAEVEVDTETGIVRVLKMVVADDVGKALNPMLLEGQLEGGIAQGIGYGIYENLILDKGRVMNPTFLDYKIPTVNDMPEIKVEMVETHDEEGPFGAKGIAESGSIPTAAAIANAVYDAIGVRIKGLPISPEKVLKALSKK
jgi:xanthine dehydrogenase molybdenum-binding subunit